MKSKMLKCYIDGSCIPNPGQIRIGGIIRSSTGVVLTYSKDRGYGTSNEAEYKSLITMLRKIRTIKDKHKVGCAIYSDSQLVVNQINGRWNINSIELQKLHKRATKLMSKNNMSIINHIPREKNQEADALTR